jgi:hypothetical protein
MAFAQTAPQTVAPKTNQTPLPEPRDQPPPAAPDNALPTTSAVAVLGRLTWMLFGPFVLLVTTIALFGKSPRLFTAADGVYFAALAATLAGRWVEFGSGCALTATGERATARHLRAYLAWAAAIGLAIWVAAKLARGLGLLG